MVDWQVGATSFLQTISDVLTAGIAITTFSLFLFTITYKLHERVTNSFTILLFCLILIFGADAFATVFRAAAQLNIILRVHWLGLILLPAIFFQFSDAVLAMTGRPSRGRRRVIGFLFIVASGVFIFLLPGNLLLGELVIADPPAPHLMRTRGMDIFTAYYVLAFGLAAYNLVRALLRTITPTSRRRMTYLVVSSLGPALGSFPYLLYGSGFAAQSTMVFWLISALMNLFVGAAVVLITYTVSFFGFPWPDRFIKSRLFRWIMRGPFTASITLAATTIIRRTGDLLGMDLDAFVVLSMVAVIVLFEYSVTLFAPIWERILFYGTDREELQEIRDLENRLLTRNDLAQFLELVLAALCDRLRSTGALALSSNGNGLHVDAHVGKARLTENNLAALEKFIQQRKQIKPLQVWKSYHLIPLYAPKDKGQQDFIGMIAMHKIASRKLEDEQKLALERLCERAVIALQDRRNQEELVLSLEMLTPQTSVIQSYTASGRFQQIGGLEEGLPLADKELVDKLVKGALTHMWGGPKMLNNPLQQLVMVREKANQSGETMLNALREVLRELIERLRPAGSRQYTNEWILYNLLVMRFVEGMKVKDVAQRLALSEADLYRKQKVAVSTVASLLINTELKQRK